MALDTTLKDLIENIKKLTDLPGHKKIIQTNFDTVKGACSGSTNVTVLQAEEIYFSYTKLQNCDVLKQELEAGIHNVMNCVKPYLIASEKPIEFYHPDDHTPYTISLADDEVVVKSTLLNYPE